jgi:hypothetical protein
VSAVTVPIQGRVKSYGAKLSTTGVTTVFTAQEGTQAVVVAINLSNIDGTSSVDATVEWYDLSVTTSFRITSTDAVAADAREYIEFPIALDPGDEIRVTAGAANDLDVIVTVVETPGNAAIR